MKKIKCIFLLFLIIIMTFSFTINSYAGGVKVTEENLKASFEKIVKTEDNKDVKIKIENNVITIESDDEIYKLDYDITGKPTFTCVANIKNGMSYEEYKNETDKLLAGPMLAYMAVADIQGIDSDKSMEYFLLTVLSSMFSNLTPEDSNYILVTEISEGMEITSETSEVIYASEFDKYVMEYTNSVYGNKKIYEDDEKILKLSMEQKEKTNDSCKIISTIIIDTDKDFSKAKEAIEKFENNIEKMFENISSQNNTQENSNNNNSTSNNSNNTISSNVSISFNTQMTEEEIKQALANEKQNRYKKVLELLENGKVSCANVKKVDTPADSKFPRTGIETNPLLIAAYVVFSVSIIGIIYLFIISKKNKNNK